LCAAAEVFPRICGTAAAQVLGLDYNLFKGKHYFLAEIIAAAQLIGSLLFQHFKHTNCTTYNKKYGDAPGVNSRVSAVPEAKRSGVAETETGIRDAEGCEATNGSVEVTSEVISNGL
jgi:hypothetical protein